MQHIDRGQLKRWWTAGRGMSARWGLSALLGFIPGAAMPAADDYPSRPITLVVSYPAGGATDSVGRIIAGKLTELTRQQVLVDNRGGAGSTIGTRFAAQAKPDGYTLLLGDMGLPTGPAMFKNLGYDPKSDLLPVAFVGSAPLVLVAHPSLKAASLKEMIALASAKPGSVSIAYPDAGTPYLAVIALLQATGVKMNGVPYKGGGPALSDVLGGHVAMTFSSTTVVRAQVGSGQLRALAVTGAGRSPILPEVPTFKEAGLDLSIMDSGSWWGILAPKGTPAPYIDKLNALIATTLDDAPTRARLAANGVTVRTTKVQEFGEFLNSQYSYWPAALRQAGVEPQ
jgi:tripartite-type tricarboxylate transporter receptor subunit TctC